MVYSSPPLLNHSPAPGFISLPLDRSKCLLCQTAKCFACCLIKSMHLQKNWAVESKAVFFWFVSVGRCVCVHVHMHVHACMCVCAYAGYCLHMHMCVGWKVCACVLKCVCLLDALKIVCVCAYFASGCVCITVCVYWKVCGVCGFLAVTMTFIVTLTHPCGKGHVQANLLDPTYQGDDHLPMYITSCWSCLYANPVFTHVTQMPLSLHIKP